MISKALSSSSATPEALCQALEGRDAVICALGARASPFREVTLLSSATRVLLSAMKYEQVLRAFLEQVRGEACVLRSPLITW